VPGEYYRELSASLAPGIREHAGVKGEAARERERERERENGEWRWRNVKCGKERRGGLRSRITPMAVEGDRAANSARKIDSLGDTDILLHPSPPCPSSVLYFAPGRASETPRRTSLRAPGTPLIFAALYTGCKVTSGILRQTAHASTSASTCTRSWRVTSFLDFLSSLNDTAGPSRGERAESSEESRNFSSMSDRCGISIRSGNPSVLESLHLSRSHSASLAMQSVPSFFFFFLCIATRARVA